MLKRMLKRLFDILCSSVGILVLWPLLLIISIAILIDDGRPVFYRQERMGYKKKRFKVIKFRSMKKGTRVAATTELKEAEERITKTGEFLRRFSLDELPQIFNVFMGTMSVVGPRPLIPKEKRIRTMRDKYNVYSVKPGITGWAQVNGRDNVNIEQKVMLDKEYVEHWGFFFDLKIIFKTVKIVLSGEGIREGHETNPNPEQKEKKFIKRKSKKKK